MTFFLWNREIAIIVTAEYIVPIGACSVITHFALVAKKRLAICKVATPKVTPHLRTISIENPMELFPKGSSLAFINSMYLLHTRLLGECHQYKVVVVGFAISRYSEVTWFRSAPMNTRLWIHTNND